MPNYKLRICFSALFHCWFSMLSSNQGHLNTQFAVPDGPNEIKELEVYQFTGAGGVALSMYNTDEVYIHQMSSLFLLLESQFEVY